NGAVGGPIWQSPPWTRLTRAASYSTVAGVARFEFCFFAFRGTACFTRNAGGWEGWPSAMGWPLPTHGDHYPHPARLRPHQKICRTQNPEGSKFPRVCWPKNHEVKQLVLHTYRRSDTNPARSSSLASHFAAADRRTRTRD